MAEFNEQSSLYARLEQRGYKVESHRHNYGHGEVEVVQVIPPNINTEDAKRSTRKQIYMPGYNPSGKKELAKLRGDLLTLAAANDGEPIITMGVAFTGQRTNSARFVEGLPDGVHATQMQFEKAKDFVAATEGLIEGGNAEIVAHSAGGPVAQLAVSLGLEADTVGLFNAAGMYKEGQNDFPISRFLPESTRQRIRKTFDGVRAFGKKLQAPITSNEDVERPLWDRFKRSRAERYSAYRSVTHPLMKDASETQFVVGSSRGDKIFPRRRIRKVLTNTGAHNVTFVDLDWHGHGLGGKRKLDQRQERLTIIAKEMQTIRGSRQTTSS